MRIVFFGSSHGVPEPNRRCSSTLIEVGDARYFIDMGTQSIEQLITRRIPVESVKAIFVTHMHGDHTNGLVSFADLCSWYFKNANPAFYLPGDTEKTAKGIAGWLDCNGVQMRDFHFGHVDENFIYADENMKVTAFKTQHIDASYSYLVEAEGKRVFFSGDLHTPPVEDVALASLEGDIDLAIMELAHFEADEKYIPVFQDKTNVKQICINHFSEFRHESGYKFKRLLPGIPVVFAYDGTEFNL